MVPYRLALLGAFNFEVEGGAPVKFSTAKTIAILAYLALESRAEVKRTHQRRTLAALLWPEIGERYALQNLRNTLYSLRQTLEQTGTTPPLLEVTRQTVTFNSAAVTVDVLELQALAESVATHAHEQLHACSICVEKLVRAVALYRGEVLAGFSLADAPAFEEWLLLQRESIHQRAVFVTSQLADVYEARQALAEAQRTVHRLLELDPYREESHRQLMRILVRQQAPHLALTQYEKLRQLLQVEFGSEPSQETQALVQQIAAGEFDKMVGGQDDKVARWQDDKAPSDGQAVLSSAYSEPLSPALDLSDVPNPGPFFGRVRERRQIAHWLLHERARMVALLGIGGVGKTSLAAQCVREVARDAADSPFERVLWRSLLNAPPLTELLPPLLQALSDQQLADPPQSVDEQLRLLLDYLHKQRVLLVLDNMESILEPAQAGAYRHGYEPYGQLIQQVATHQHQSLLLLTSRERPRGYERLEKDGIPMHSLLLTGLDDEAGHQLLAQRGLLNGSGNQAELITRYAGHPLALKLVADTVEDIFGGDIGEFLAEDTLVFDDMRTILDQQFARLANLEQQIIFWLAIEREATSLSTLRSSLLNSPPQRRFVEALRNLQRRSLVERQGADFVLQNVVTEYLTERLVEIAVEEIETGVLNILCQHALLKAQAKVYVYESQVRLILTPIGERLIEKLGRAGLQARLRQLIADLRLHTPRAPNYAGGNLLNLLLALNVDLTGYDFSRLAIWQANLQRAKLTDVNFSEADFTNTLFVDTFGGVRALALHAGQQLLASAAEGDPLIRLWRLGDGQLLAALAGHELKGISLAFHPAGHLLASGSEDHTIRIWDIASGRSIRTLRGHQGGVASVAFSPDGALLASGGTDNCVRIWAVDTGQLLVTLPTHDRWVEALAFHPDGNLLATANHRAIALWDIAELASQTNSRRANGDSFRPIHSLQEEESYALSLAFSPDGALLASGKENSLITVWHVASRTKIHTLRGHATEVNSIAFSPVGEMLASSSYDGTVRLWDIASGQVIDILRGHPGPVPTIVISDDGETLISGGTDGVIQLWELQRAGSRRVVRSLRGSLSQLEGIAFSSQGVIPHGVMLAAGGGKGWCHIWHIDRATTADDQHQDNGVTVTYGRVLKGHTGRINTVDFCPGAPFLATAGDDQTVRVWNAASGECLIVLQAHTAIVLCLAFNQQGTMLASGANNGFIHLWDIDAKGHFQLRHTLSESRFDVRSLVFSPDGKTLASSSNDCIIRLWDSESGELLQTTPLTGAIRRSLDFDPDGERLAVGSIDGNIQVWSFADRALVTPIQSFHHGQAAINVVAFSPLGDLLASGAFDTTLRIWDPETGEVQRTLAGYTQGVRDLAFWPGSNIVATTGGDGLVRLYDAASGHLLQTFSAPGPYEGMNITGVTGISAAQRASLKALGAVEDEK